MSPIKVKLLGIVIVIVVLRQIFKLWLAEPEKSVPEEFIAEKEKNQRILITVYYEALCPDSRSFILKQVVPTFESIDDYINLQLVPYGKAETIVTTDDYLFKCQHGEVECEANIIHACSIDKIRQPRKQLDMIACMIKTNQNPQAILKSCSTDMNEYKTILSCSQSNEGKRLLAKYGEMTNTLNPRVSFIPTITLNNEQDNQILILKNLLRQVCRKLSLPPDVCKE